MSGSKKFASKRSGNISAKGPRTTTDSDQTRIERQKKSVKLSEKAYICDQCGGKGTLMLPEFRKEDEGVIWFLKLKKALACKPDGWNLFMTGKDIIVIRDPENVNEPLDVSGLRLNLGQIIAYESAALDLGIDLPDMEQPEEGEPSAE